MGTPAQLDPATIQRIQEAFWAGVVFLITLVVYFYLSHRDEDYAPTRWTRWKASIMSRLQERRQRASAFGKQPESLSNEPPNEPERAANLALESRTDDRTGTFVLTDAERLAVTKMIYHKASNPKATKASAILVGFGVKKGDSATYRRASAIYDALFVLPEPDKYPSMTSEQHRLRDELGLSTR